MKIEANIAGAKDVAVVKVDSVKSIDIDDHGEQKRVVLPQLQPLGDAEGSSLNELGPN